MKTISFSVFFMLICIVVYSQKNMDDVVYLKNGSKIQGTILQIIPDSVVQIKQMGGKCLAVFNERCVADFEGRESEV